MHRSSVPAYRPFTRLTRGALAAATLLALSVATGAHAGEPGHAPGHPGAVFSTLEAAASAALHDASERARRSRVEWGGTIYRVEGGYAYSAPRRGNANGVKLRLGSGDVAWYYAHGERGSHAANRVSERDRRMGDRVDPLHRPLFVLSPNGMPMVYREGRLAAIADDLPRRLVGEESSRPSSG